MASPVPVSQRSRLYFVSAPVDFALIGGLSIVCFAALRQAFPGGTTPEVGRVAALLLWVVNWPHFAATSYRLYHRKENLLQYPVTAMLTPVVVLAGMLACFASPGVMAPYWVKLYLIWSPWHFSGQTVGITLLYARRAGLPISGKARLGLSAFVFGSFITQTARFEASPLGARYFGIPYPGLGLPDWVADVTAAMMYVGGAAFLYLVLRDCRADRRRLPAIVLLPALAQWMWFVGGSGQAAFREFVPAFHSLQYLLIAWSIQMKESLDRGGHRPSRRFVLGETLRWALVNAAGGALLFWVLPRAFLPAAADLTFATGVVHAGVQIHHFFVDGVIWKLHDPRVVSPLLVTWDEIAGVRLAPAGGA